MFVYAFTHKLLTLFKNKVSGDLLPHLTREDGSTKDLSARFPPECHQLFSASKTNGALQEECCLRSDAETLRTQAATFTLLQGCHDGQCKHSGESEHS